MLHAQHKLHFDFLIHAGDIRYCGTVTVAHTHALARTAIWPKPEILDSYANGKPGLWDVWGQLVEPLAAQVPWMVSQGNHEVACLGYLYRFAMPGTPHASPIGPKH
jgi:hypothetical protein